MGYTPEISEYWETTKAETGIEWDLLGAWPFGDSPELADELLGHILVGRKRASTNLVRELEHLGEPEPRVGAYTIVLDGSGRPGAVIRTVSTRRTTFADVDAEHAYWEGEDDRTLESYLREHNRYFTRLGRSLGFEFSDDMEVVLERFELVYPVNDQ